MGRWIPPYIRPIHYKRMDLIWKVGSEEGEKLPSQQKMKIYKEIGELYELIKEMENLQKRVVLPRDTRPP